MKSRVAKTKRPARARRTGPTWVFAGLLTCLPAEAGQREPYRNSEHIIGIIHDGAFDKGVHPLFAEAMARIESNLNPDAVSATGCAGLMQLCRAAARDVGVTDRLDPVQNVHGALTYFRWLVNRYRELGDDATCLALLAYYRGMAVADPVGSCAAVPAVGQRYIRTVLNEFRRLKREASAAGRVFDVPNRAGLDRTAAGREAGLAGRVFDGRGTDRTPHRDGLAGDRDALRRYARCRQGHLPPWECR